MPNVISVNHDRNLLLYQLHTYVGNMQPSTAAINLTSQAADLCNYTAEVLCRNSSRISTTEIVPIEISLISSIFAGIFIGVVILIIAFGNGMVVIAVMKDRHLKRALQNRFIVSLAVADMLLGTCIMPLSLHLEILKYWALGTILCDIWLAIDVFLCTASTLSLVVVSLDRYWSVTKALEYPQLRTSRKVNISIAGIWLTSALVSLPPLAGWKGEVPSGGDPSPQCNLSEELGYIIYSLTISFYIPLIIILIAYGRIFLVARRRANQQIKLGTIQSVPSHSSRDERQEMSEVRTTNMKICHPSSESPSGSNYSIGSSFEQHKQYNDAQSFDNGSAKPLNEESSTDGDDGVQHKRQSKFSIFTPRFMHGPPKVNSKDAPQIEKLLKDGRESKKFRNQRGRERRATITIAMIVMAFVICWLPFSMLYLIDRICLCGIKDNFMFSVTFWLGYCNSAVNPVLYSIFNRDFRQAFKRILCKRRSR